MLLLLIQAYPADAGDDPIGDAIARGVDSIFSQLNTEDVIRHRTGGTPREDRGRVVKATSRTVTMETADGRKLVLPRDAILTWQKRGLAREEMEAPHRTGPSTLAAFALVSAQVAASHPRLEPLLATLEEGPGDGAGTYVYSLRASLWSALLDRPLSPSQKSRYRMLLKHDVNWLTRAARPNGWYGYTNGSADGDHSNTQFANLGVWAGSIGKVEIAKAHWRAMAKHWLEQQNGDGGWSYNEVTRASSASMTLAGCNSLYIALDRHYAMPESAYRLFEGFERSKAQREQIAHLWAAIERGDRFLADHPPDPDQSQSYELFGLERLGLASGRAFLGGKDWFRQFAGRGITRRWGQDIIADSFWLIYLVHGHAPVLFQKLEHGNAWETWNYYPRELESLTRAMNRAFERLHRWQRLPATAGLSDMQEAPFLYLAGYDELILSQEGRNAIRQYIDQGGTVILHADLASKKFVDSATTAFETMFQEWGVRFTEIEENHPLRRCYFGGKGSEWKRTIPLRGLFDGRRLLVLLIPVDIAGAWPQERAAFADLTRIMINLRVFAAPPYAELPRVMRRTPPISTVGITRTTLRLARLQDRHGPRVHPTAWSKARERLRGTTAVDLQILNDSDAWSSADLVHLGVCTADPPDAARLRELSRYMEQGGVVLIDAVDGAPEIVSAVSDWVTALNIGERHLLGADHPIVRGAGSTGPLPALEPTEAGLSLLRGGAVPPIVTRRLNGRTALLACPFDLTAGLDGGFVWGRIGYRPESTLTLVGHLVIWRAAELTAGGR